MESGLKIGHIWKIPIRLHTSWFLILGLVTWSLAQGYFPQAYPTLTAPVSWLLGALTSLLFAASVVLHELGHSYLAIRNGIPVKGITLFIFGGVAQIGKEPSDPRAEFRIAVAGPAVSLALAGIFYGLWLVDRSVPALAAPSEWLARINFTLAAFNLIPGFPLDGGRVLRALVWRATGSFNKATQAASYAGQVMAVAFIGFGIYTVLRRNFFDGLWLTFIGWFLQNAAASVYAQAGLQQSLRGVRVSQVMARDLPLVPAVTRLDALVQEYVLGAGQRTFIVADEASGIFRGMLTLGEIKEVPQADWPNVTVGQAMRLADQVVAANPDTPLMAALQDMDDAGVNQVPVLEGGVICGLLTREQVLRYVRLRAEIGM